jgi:hypothetical protein
VHVFFGKAQNAAKSEQCGKHQKNCGGNPCFNFDLQFRRKETQKQLECHFSTICSQKSVNSVSLLVVVFDINTNNYAVNASSFISKLPF